ncbi:hypothetical protein BGZ67_007963, partial [Mortierella alpina]
MVFMPPPTATYSFLYFDTEGICTSVHNLFALQDAAWKQLYPKDWENEDGLDKASTPFGVLPVLYVHSLDGSQTVQIAEVKNIELYLAESLLTSAVWDDFLSTAVALKSTNPDAKQEQLALFLTEKIPKWIALHEQHLAANELNGHYVGDEITLADPRSAALASLVVASPQGQALLTPETAPGLLKVKEAVDQDPRIQQWRASELFKSLLPIVPSPRTLSPPALVTMIARATMSLLQKLLSVTR